jgi:hypothetical protein
LPTTTIQEVVASKSSKNCTWIHCGKIFIHPTVYSFSIQN